MLCSAQNNICNIITEKWSFFLDRIGLNLHFKSIIYSFAFKMKHQKIKIYVAVASLAIFAASCASHSKNTTSYRPKNSNAVVAQGSKPKTSVKKTNSISGNATETTKKSGATNSALTKKMGFTVTQNDDINLYNIAAGWLGTPYKYGGNTKKGTDCSGLTNPIYNEAYGIKLSRSSADILTNNCTRIQKSQLSEGDLVFFRTDGRKSSIPNHVGIYLKDGMFIHSSTSKGVIISSIKADYYVKNWITGGRVRR